MVSAWPEPPFASIAGVCDGIEALALGGVTTETRPKWAGRRRTAFAFLPVLHFRGEDYTLAETTKLSVGRALEKLCSTDTPKAKIARLDERIDTLDEEAQRLRAMRRRLERDQQALEYFVYRAGLLAGMLAAALGGLDAFVFTAGIGENSATIRARIAERLGWLGVGLIPKPMWRERSSYLSKDSHVAVYVVPTN